MVYAEMTCIPALRVCSFTEPKEYGVLSQYILVIQRSYNLREKLHQLSILITLHLNFVDEFQLKFPCATEGIQQFCPCFHLCKIKRSLPPIFFHVPCSFMNIPLFLLQHFRSLENNRIKFLVSGFLFSVFFFFFFPTKIKAFITYKFRIFNFEN